MDGWARSKPQGGAAPKRQAVGTEALLAKATLLISKLTLKKELEIRELQSAVFRTLTLSFFCEFVVRMRAATKSYIDESKAARDQGQAPQGEMHVYAWEALTRVAVEAQDAPSKVISVIQKHRDEATDPTALGAAIYICKIKKTYDKGIVKLRMAGRADMNSVLDARSR